MARSSKPRRARSRATPYRLVLTRGGTAELYDPADDLVWASSEDQDFMADYPDFLEQEDLEDILEFLVDVGELTDTEADQADVEEEFLTPADLTGSIPPD